MGGFSASSLGGPTLEQTVECIVRVETTPRAFSILKASKDQHHPQDAQHYVDSKQ